MNHQHYLLTALTLARSRKGFCSPNPSVGAIVVKDDQIISSGYHQGPGFAHAEVMACEGLDEIEDASLYVTLEPCCHVGRTPPCTDFIIKRGIKKVYFSHLDPNPKVAGKGKEILNSHGILCEQIVIPEIAQFYQSYQHWTKTHRPRVVTKLAMSLDSKIADEAGKPVSITGKEARQFTHQSRLQADAILTSIRTLILDDPALNVRLAEPISKSVYVLDSQLAFPLNAKVLTTTEKITVFHSSEDKHKIAKLEEYGIQCFKVSRKLDNLDLDEVITHIGLVGIHELWVEAGGRVFSSFIHARLVQESLIYIAPKLLGERAYSAFNEESNIFALAKQITWFNLGQDSVCKIEW